MAPLFEQGTLLFMSTRLNQLSTFFGKLNSLKMFQAV